jgi:hypothetical protein
MFFTRFKNVTFDIMATEDVGIFDVRSKFLGVEMEKVQLNIQVSWDFYRWGRVLAEGLCDPEPHHSWQQ